MRVLVLGARGQLGAAVVDTFKSGHDVTALDRDGLDICDSAAVMSTVARLRPAAIVNCAAFNAVDAAEDVPVEAFRVNALALRSLARAARAIDATLVHYSSDFVFDGQASTPYTEEDLPNPRSAYAASKLIGEWFAADVPSHYVLRVESLFGDAPQGPPPKGTVASMIAALRAGSNPVVFEDRTASPTSVIDAARATRVLVERRAAPGLYHCVNSGHCTWAEFAHEAARLLAVEPRFTVVRMADVPLRAERPLYCALSNDKLRAAGVDMPTWQEALAHYVRGGRQA